MAKPRAGIIDLLLTYDCNCVCPYCFVKDRGSPVSMSVDILDQSIDWIASEGDRTIEVVFLGGEPTLEPLLIERAVRRARDWENRVPIRFQFTMTTNALLLDDELIENLASWNVKYMISLDGYGKRHDRARPVKGGTSGFEAVINKISKIKTFQSNLAVRFTVIPKNVGWLAEDMEAIHNLGFDYFIVAPATGIEWSDEALDQFASQAVSFVKNRKRVNGHFEPRVSPFDDKPKGRGKWGCGAGNGRYAIDPLGNIFACARFAELEAERGLILGDIYNGVDPFGNILEFQDSSLHSRPQCIDCYLSDRCLGGCPAINFEDTGSILSASPNECRFNKVTERIRDEIQQYERPTYALNR